MEKLQKKKKALEKEDRGRKIIDYWNFIYLLWEFPVKMQVPFLGLISCMTIILSESLSFG